MIFNQTADVTTGMMQYIDYFSRASLRKQTKMSNILFPINTSVIHAYATAGLPNQAENVMRLMFSDFKNGNVSAEPNVRCLTSKEI